MILPSLLSFLFPPPLPPISRSCNRFRCIILPIFENKLTNVAGPSSMYLIHCLIWLKLISLRRAAVCDRSCILENASVSNLGTDVFPRFSLREDGIWRIRKSESIISSIDFEGLRVNHGKTLQIKKLHMQTRPVIC